MKRMISIVAVALFLFSLVFTANAAETSRLMTHKKWFSLIVHDNPPYARLASFAEGSGNDIRIFLDFYPDDTYIVSIYVDKGKDKGKQVGKGLTDHEFQTRVDNQPTFYTQGAIADNRENWKFFLGNGFNNRLIEEAKEGDYLRVKLFDQSDDTITRFSLQGFTSAYNRAQQLKKTLGNGQSDGSYFEKERPRQRHQKKSDASYF